MSKVIQSFLLLPRLSVKRQTVAEPVPSWLGWTLVAAAKQSGGTGGVAVEKRHIGARCLQGNKQTMYNHNITLLLSFLLGLAFYVSWVKDVLVMTSTSLLHEEILLG